MKKNTLFILVILLTSCNPFGKNDVMNYETELNELVMKLEEYPQGQYDRGDINKFMIADVSYLYIDLIIKNIDKGSGRYFGFVEKNDSLIIFINKSENMFDTEERIIYDFAKEPRNFGNNKIIGAAYEITQVDERWYYSEEGFD
ncbi:hypothetical protein Fleli_4019 [Bernardetia litoralis DSM 6794]|uniref:Uncharacterized protein n=1 Tax=Bernardetia litoralis (strain ATCC 23117 / DSM 6794 / NBRC 15988 / NCIMB 1366 / Fx l1 / Sio-4) TaxID=880071 RepID=I4AQT4_BERLS|nr:hypothetical protein [Bernardetia litoralis]AFM06319.1 hypothetical protein Fleli_4019 [Bernardetia litoralis DSM 6794]